MELTKARSALSAVLFFSATALAVPAVAQEAPTAEPAPASGLKVGSVGLGIGTNGLLIDYAYGINRWVDVRAGFNFSSLNKDTTEDDIEYDAKIKFSGGKLLLDIKPFAGGFRISTGIYTSPPEFELEADGQDDYEIGDSTYRGDLQVDAEGDLGSTAPYLGIGWGGTTNGSGFGVSFDLGVMFTDAPKFGIDVTGRACDASLNEACDPAGADGFDVNDPADPRAALFQSEKETERRNLEDDAKDFDLWPVIQLAMHYRF